MSELVKHFGIDWKLLLAQAVNFLILLFILKRFAYEPILRILRKRKEEIEKGIHFKEEAEKELKNIHSLKEETIRQAKAEAFSVVVQAEERGEERKGEILKEADKKVQVMVQEAKRRLEEEKAKTQDKVYQDAVALIQLAVARVLKKMPPLERDQHLVQEALQELKRFKAL